MNSYIPEELWPGILCKLPVKSLLRFRCVSKSWKLMIDDPDFWHLHLNCYENNSQQTHLLFMLAEEWGLDCVVKSSDTMDTTERFGALEVHDGSKAITIFDSFGFHGDWIMVGLMDGLVLLREHDSSELLLWNPSIRKFRIIPPSPKISEGMRNFNMGLGFDPLTKDYKFVKLVVHSDNSSVHSVSVYSVMTGLWKTVEFWGKGFSDWPWTFLTDGPLGYKAFCFQGYLCVIGINVDLDIDGLVAFDLSSEVFAVTSLPQDEDEPINMFNEDLIVLNDECLLLKCNVYTTDGEIWVLESGGTGFESMYWKKRCSFFTDTPYLYDVYVFKNGDLMLRDSRTLGRFIVETQELKILLSQPETEPKVVDVCEYVESLVLLN